MHAPNQSAVGIEVEVAVTVSRNAEGTLEDGVVTVIESVDSVTAVERISITGLTPRLNDMAVEATVTLNTSCATTEEVTSALEDSFGIRSVTVARAANPPSNAQPQNIQFG